MKETRKVEEYEVDIYWDERDQIFVAEIPELSGCAAHGDSRAEALLNAEVAISNWLKAAREIGQKIPRPRSRIAAA